MTEWTAEVCASQPDELQTIADGLYMQRRNIEEVEATDEDGNTYTRYECECREITASEYAMLESIEEIDTTAAIDEYTLELIEEGIL